MAQHLNVVKLSAARLWAAHKFPYFASGLFAMVPVSTPGLGSCAVDTHWRLYVDPNVVEQWSVPKLGAVLVHELSHLLRDHARARNLRLSDLAQAVIDGEQTLARQTGTRP